MNTVKKTPNPIDVHVGARIRLRRNLIGMSQEKLGENLGVTFQQVQKYEKGSNRVGASRLQNIAKILGTPISYFFDDAVVAQAIGSSAPVLTEMNDISTFISTKEGLDLNKAFVLIKDPVVRQNIVKLTKSVANGPQDIGEPSA